MTRNYSLGIKTTTLLIDEINYTLIELSNFLTKLTGKVEQG